MLQVTVKRSQWNGNTLATVTNSCLRSASGMMCCLGFACIAAGIPEESLINVSYVHELTRDIDIPASLLHLLSSTAESWGQSEVSAHLTNLNDNSRWSALRIHPATMADKEAKLIELGRKANIEFTFID